VREEFLCAGSRMLRWRISWESRLGLRRKLKRC